MSTEESNGRNFQPSSIAATTNASASNLPNHALTLDSVERDLLNDPALVENFADVLKIRPLGYNKSSMQSDTDIENESASGSVIVTRKPPTGFSSTQRPSALSNASVNLTPQADQVSALDNGRSVNDNDYLKKEDEVKAQISIAERKEKFNEGEECKEVKESLEHSQKQTQNEDKEVVMGNTWNLDDFREDINAGGTDATESLELAHEYDYSDSDFEDNMEKRLQDLSASPSSSERSESREDEGKDDDFDGLNLDSSDDEDHENAAGCQLLVKVDNSKEAKKDWNKDIEDETDEEEEEEEEYGYGPQYPPKELDPEKLYALHDFFGQDPSHCQLEQDESCVLLNDQDSYWWLVKRLSDNKIGFAPAELLETFPERLARLNCWKNENMSSHSFGSKKDDVVDDQAENETNKPSPVRENRSSEAGDGLSEGSVASTVLKDYKKGNKSVSFNDVVGYADRYIEGEMEYNEEHDGRHHDEFTQVNSALNDNLEDDDISEVVSDVSFNIASMTPLDIKKVRQPENKQDGYVGSAANDLQNKFTDERPESPENKHVEKGEDDDLRKIFEAPVVPFVKSNGRNGTGMANSNSDYSISTIGEFSPSSSEWTNDSPRLADEKFEGESAVIPSSRAIQDFSKFVETTDARHAGKISSYPYDDEERTGRESDVSAGMKDDKHSKSCHEIKHNTISAGSSSSSEEEFLMESERAASSTSINSTSSASRQNSELKHTARTNTLCHHPFVDQLYSPVLLKMDDLLKQLDEFVNK